MFSREFVGQLAEVAAFLSAWSSGCQHKLALRSKASAALFLKSSPTNPKATLSCLLSQALTSPLRKFENNVNFWNPPSIRAIICEWRTWSSCCCFLVKGQKQMALFTSCSLPLLCLNLLRVIVGWCAAKNTWRPCLLWNVKTKTTDSLGFYVLWYVALIFGTRSHFLRFSPLRLMYQGFKRLSWSGARSRQVLQKLLCRQHVYLSKRMTNPHLSD